MVLSRRSDTRPLVLRKGPGEHNFLSPLGAKTGEAEHTWRQGIVLWVYVESLFDEALDPYGLGGAWEKPYLIVAHPQPLPQSLHPCNRAAL